MALLERLFQYAVQERASDLIFVPGERPIVRLEGGVSWASNEHPLDPGTIEALLRESAPEQALQNFDEAGHASFVFTRVGIGRFRAQVFEDARGLGAFFRVIPPEVLDWQRLNLPEVVSQIAELRRGLILISSPPGAGRSTSLSALVDQINRSRHAHIGTFESPVEALHQNQRAFIDQFSVTAETRAERILRALRNDYDVIVIDGLERPEDLELALAVARMGPLVLASCAATSAVSALQGLTAPLPALRRARAFEDLALHLRAVTNQRLVPRRKRDNFGAESRLPALEVLLGSKAVCEILRSGRLDDLNPLIRESGHIGMSDLNAALLKLARDSAIDALEAYRYAPDKVRILDDFRRRGVSFAPPRYADQRSAQASLRRLTQVELSQRAQAALLESSFNDATFIDEDGDTMTMLTLSSAATLAMNEAVDAGSRAASIDLGGPENNQALERSEPAALEIGRVFNAEARGRLVIRRPGAEDVVIELFGGTGIIYGRSRLDLQRGLRTDWICQALPEDDAEARRKTRRVGKIHGGFRVADNGDWQAATWMPTSLAVDKERLEPEFWYTLPQRAFALDIAQGALPMSGQAYKAQALVLRRLDDFDIWYVLLRQRVSFGLSRRGVEAGAALSSSQPGFEILRKHRGFELIPGLASRMTSRGRNIDGHISLEGGMSFALGEVEISYQALTPNDSAR